MEEAATKEVATEEAVAKEALVKATTEEASPVEEIRAKTRMFFIRAQYALFFNLLKNTVFIRFQC